jgi:KaiC/GvpD/RAD55 family RecA-like ATPase
MLGMAPRTSEGVLRSVADFAGSALAEGAAAVLIATAEHAGAFAARLAARGIDIAAAVARHQLVALDAETCLAAFLRGGAPDRDAFLALVLPVLERARDAGYAQVRLFGEMVDLLWSENREGTVQLEELWNELLADHGVSLLCAYRVDNFDPDTHRGVLHRISRCHSHLIPADDYERLDRAVDRAYTDVFGVCGEPREFREIMLAHRAPATQMPSGQAALIALRDVSPDIADEVLARARLHYGAPRRRLA